MTTAVGLRVQDFDDLPPDEAVELMLTCARITPWADAVVAGRPYRTRERLLKAARARTDNWSWDDVATALAAHPRLGNRPPAEASGEAGLSRAEQSGLGGDLADELTAVNEAYEQRFDRVLLIRAAGRSASDILRMAVRRLLMDEETDRLATTAELRDIALRRLKGLVSG
jgi:2-oxo-4-hydroxy-4-carboxy-5-ureidoimidazoline decarboxylase